MKRIPRQTIAWAVAIVVAIAGLLLTVTGMLQPVSFGWFAYQPLSSATFYPGDAGVFVSRTAMIGVAVLILGVVTIAFLAGWRAAAVRRPPAAR